MDCFRLFAISFLVRAQSIDAQAAGTQIRSRTSSQISLIQIRHFK